MSNFEEAIRNIKIGMPVWLVYWSCDAEGKERFFLDKGIVEGTAADMFYVRYEGGLTFWHSYKDFLEEVFPTEEEAQAALFHQQALVEGFLD